MRAAGPDRVDRMRQQPEEGGPEQRTGGEAHQVRDRRGATRLTERQEEGRCQRAQETAQAGQ